LDDEITKNIKLPSELSELYFGEEFCVQTPKLINLMSSLLNNLPTKLKVLKLPEWWNMPLNNLPMGLEKIILGIEFNQNLDMLSESILHVEFPEKYKFDLALDNLPHNLEYLNLQFQNKYNHSISNFPNSIKYLEIGEYNLAINKLPKNLETLLIASNVRFILVSKFFKEESTISFYKLTNIGKYNVENDIQIQIPPNLNKITWYNGDSSVYDYVKISNENLWIDKTDVKYI